MNQVIQYWRSLKEQEQRLLMFAGGVFVIFFLVMGVFRPLNSAIEKARKEQVQQAELLSYVESGVARLKAAGPGKVQSQQNLSQVVNRSKGQYQISISQMQPSANSLRLTIDSVPFNTLVEWLNELVNRHGVKIANLDLAKDTKPGYVRVSRLVLEQ